MDHADHVRLIAGAFPDRSSSSSDRPVRWADFGAGHGAFTLAVRDLAGADAEIVAVDRDRTALAALRRAMEAAFPGTALDLVAGDIRQPPALPPLDGIVAANSLHYVDRREQPAVLWRWSDLLRPEGCIVIVEYDTEAANRWVPFPVSFERLQQLCRAAGLPAPAMIGTHPSRWNDRFYAARIVPGDG